MSRPMQASGARSSEVEAPSATVLLFGDSNVMGYGVGARFRYSSVLADLVATRHTGSQTEVVQALDGFNQLVDRIPRMVDRYDPRVVVWQIPNAPLVPHFMWPRWARLLKRPQDLLQRRRREKLVADHVDDPSDEVEVRRTRNEATWLTDLDRTNIVRRATPVSLRKRYADNRPAVVRAHVAWYVEECRKVLDLLGSLVGERVVVAGTLPHSERIFPGYRNRALRVTRELQPLVEDRGHRFVDAHQLLDHQLERPNLSDGVHLTVEGHRLLGLTLAVAIDRVADAA